MARIKAAVWAAVRETADGSEFVPDESIALTKARAESLAKEVDARNPEYGEINPVVRIARFELRECTGQGTDDVEGSDANGTEGPE